MSFSFSLLKARERFTAPPFRSTARAKDFLHEGTRRFSKEDEYLDAECFLSFFVNLCVPSWWNSFSFPAYVSQRISPFLPSRKSNPSHHTVLPNETRLAVIKNAI